MLNDLERKIMDMYRNGNDISFIIEQFNITFKQVKQLLIRFKEENKTGRTFTNEFKRLISERNANGVSRKQIAGEFEISERAVKNACELFGNKISKDQSNGNKYTKIKGKFDGSQCPTCGSKKVNWVDENAIYCMNCGDEHILKKNYILRVNWEYLD